ncbi:FAD/NAD(P)-binding protein [Glarea lozoyensis ATCC 20868]|uniref:FAD/NAD(P)-binding protein n=1 Tax=Glarea lozoyensis (strain ATCC 20868 / MF5171) TaxID=1116229 RepID=S3DIX3_GLAL2|nr:FAD/NAD(P)-binding protein [Glarea lozoyensis ATCC 20868]EPE37104.1 FAD/NAD(P)-binding protein [Glarea lozoyensis ATCC 20868]
MAPISDADLNNNSQQTREYPKNGVDVIIVGTGLAGLTAALECHRKGMNVRVFEKNDTINTAGDMFFMGLSSTVIFKHWPEMKKEFDSIGLHDAYIETRKHSGEVMVPPMRVRDRLAAQGLNPSTPPGTFQMRPLIYKMFVKQVERIGIKVQFGKNVVDYYEDEETGKAGITTKDGEKFEADIVIAADGVGSKSQRVVGGQVRAIQSGRAMWRAAFPIENLDQDEEVKKTFCMIDGSKPIVRTFLAPDAYALCLTRPDLMIWIMNHNTTGSEEENWNNTIDKEEVLEHMEKMSGPQWAPVFKKLVACTPKDTIINFNLLWRNPQPTWTSPKSRVIQIGDAAHSFLPASGNGATQAIEDAISLATCLQLGGKDNIPQAVNAHIRFRFVRTACAQKIGFSNAELLQETKWDQVKLDPKKSVPKMPKWIWSHDPEIYAQENYAKSLESMKKGIPHDADDSIPPNYPPGYKFEPWSIEQIIEDKNNGRETDLGPGDWS